MMYRIYYHELKADSKLQVRNTVLSAHISTQPTIEPILGVNTYTKLSVTQS
jgi:hypothetical protein